MTTFGLNQIARAARTSEEERATNNTRRVGACDKCRKLQKRVSTLQTVLEWHPGSPAAWNSATGQTTRSTFTSLVPVAKYWCSTHIWNTYKEFSTIPAYEHLWLTFVCIGKVSEYLPLSPT